MWEYSYKRELRRYSMHIRQQHPILDRTKVLLVLGSLFLILIVIACFPLKKNSEKKKSLEDLLVTALEPVGTTMYIWGGGWPDENDPKSGTSTKIGVRPEWKKFARKQDENYDFKEYRYQREKGLDCSGYVGWVLYNIFEKEDDHLGYVTTSTNLASSLAEKGWGKLIYHSKTFLPGDIVSMEGHVWICLGTCKDGSVLLVHSSPPGVSVCGTQALEKEGLENEGESSAIFLATQYMSIFHPKWQEKYPNREVPISYLENVSVFRWNQSILRDEEVIHSMSAEEIMEMLTGKSEIP